MRAYSIFPKAPGVEPHHQTVNSRIQDTCCRVLPISRDAELPAEWTVKGVVNFCLDCSLYNTINFDHELRSYLFFLGGGSFK